MNITAQEHITKSKLNAEKTFADWMALPTTKLLISMVPKLDNPDVFTTLLKSGFDCGYGNGEASMAVTIMTKMMEGRRDKD